MLTVFKNIFPDRSYALTYPGSESPGAHGLGQFERASAFRLVNAKDRRVLCAFCPFASTTHFFYVGQNVNNDDVLSKNGPHAIIAVHRFLTYSFTSQD